MSFYVILAFLSLAQLDEPETWISVLIIIPNTDNKYSIQRGASTTTPFDLAILLELSDQKIALEEISAPS